MAREREGGPPGQLRGGSQVGSRITSAHYILRILYYLRFDFKLVFQSNDSPEWPASRYHSGEKNETDEYVDLIVISHCAVGNKNRGDAEPMSIFLRVRLRPISGDTVLYDLCVCVLFPSRTSLSYDFAVDSFPTTACRR